MLRKAIAGMGAATVALGTATIVTAPAASAQVDCTPVHIVSIPGAGGTHSGAGNGVTNAMEGAVATAVADARPGQVSMWQPAYPASAGAAWSAVAPGNDGTTFGHARLTGDKMVLDHLRGYIANCSESKIAVLGFSEGAAVGGDVLSLLANGAVGGLTDDNILGGILFADPGRSGHSEFTGPSQAEQAYIEHPDGAEYQRNGEYSTPTSANSVGWVGQRSLDFGNVGQRVISVCNDADIACSVPIGSTLRDVADISDKNITPNSAYRSGVTVANMVNEGKLTSILAQAVLLDGILADIQNGDITWAINKLDGLIDDQTSLSMDERGMLLNLTSEVRELLEILAQDKAYGDTVTEGQILKHVIETAASGFPGGEAIGELLSFLVTPDTPPIPADIAERIAPQVEAAGAFGVEHGVYWGPSGYQVNGMVASDWAVSALTSAVDRAVSGETITVGTGDSPRTGPEVAEPDRADDGLRYLLETGELPPGEDPFPVPTTTSPVPSPKPTSTPTTPTTSSPTTTSTPSSVATVSPTETDEPTPSPIAAPTLNPVSDNTKYGPSVETGGKVTQSWFGKVLNLIR